MLRSAALLLSAAMATVDAQDLQVECLAPAGPTCRTSIAVADSMQSAQVALRVTRNGTAVPNAYVSFKATAGAMKPDTAVTDANGVARALWFRFKGGDPVLIAIEARSPAGGLTVPQSAVQSVFLVPADVETRGLTLVPEKGFQQSWFEKSQLPRPVMVQLRPAQGENAITAKACASNKVHFRARGAPQSVSPDTAVAYMDAEGRCLAQTFWSMGEGIGERRLDVRLVPGRGFKAENTEEAFSWTRATPRFIAGFASGWLRPYTTVNPASKRVVRIERTDASGVTRSYDSTETTGAAAIKDVPGERKNSAVAALSLPIPIARWEDWDNLSLTVGVDLGDISARQYYGMSLLRWAGRWVPVIEVLPIDFHVLRMYARQPELVDPRCAPADCVARNRTKFQGWAYMVSADATSLVSELVKKLAP